MASKQIIIRVRSPEKIHRYTFDAASASTRDLMKKVCEELQEPVENYSLHKEQNPNSVTVPISARSPLNKFPNGMMFYLFRLKNASMEHQEAMLTDEPSSASKDSIMDPVDTQLLADQGKIERKRDEKLCRHGDNSRCIHCSPLEPYDEALLKEQKIKHLSFHSYLRKMSSSASGSKFVGMEDLNCKIKPGCKDHLPWPKGICSKCQPSAITLNRQSYRHVDNVMFENPRLVERFFNFWRTTGYQRIGFLYGRYEQHSDVPLGIRATVSAIYEPPQENSRDLVKLLPDDRQEIVDRLAQTLGLSRVGWIFTDLVVDDVKKGTVKNLRGIDSHFLTAQECITAGHFQNQHPNYIHKSQFGSKFVTVCVTGDKDNQVHTEGYSVSNQCMALVRDNCLVPTKDAPELGFIRKSSNEQYVPDVFYKVTDEYKNDVQRLARPLPVEYLLVDVPASTPKIPLFTFQANQSQLNKEPFPIENRLVDHQIQDFSALTKYYQQFNLLTEGGHEADKAKSFLEAISDFHVLLYVATMDMLPLKDHMAALVDAVCKEDALAAWQWSRTSQWTTVEQLMLAAAGPEMASSGGFSPMGEGPPQIPPMPSSWICNYCTFENQPQHMNCEMCNLPK